MFLGGEISIFHFALGFVTASLLFLLVFFFLFLFLRKLFRTFSLNLEKVSLEEILGSGEPPTKMDERDRKALSSIEKHLDPLVMSLAERDYRGFFSGVARMVRDMAVTYRGEVQGDPLLHLSPSEIASIIWRAQYHVNNMLYRLDKNLGFLRLGQRSLLEIKELVEKSAELYKKAGPFLKVARVLRPLFMAGEVGAGALNPVIALLLLIGSEAFSNLAARLGKRLAYELVLVNLSRISVVVVGLEAASVLRRKRLLTYGAVKAREMVRMASSVKLSGDGVKFILREITNLEDIDSLQALYLQRCLAEGRSPEVVGKGDFHAFLSSLRDESKVLKDLKESLEKLLSFSLEADEEKLMKVVIDVEKRLGIRISVGGDHARAMVSRALRAFLEDMGIGEEEVSKAISFISKRLGIPMVEKGERISLEGDIYRLFLEGMALAVSFLNIWELAEERLRGRRPHSYLLERASQELSEACLDCHKIDGRVAVKILGRLGAENVRFVYKTDGSYIVLSRDGLFLASEDGVFRFKKVKIERKLEKIKEVLEIKGEVETLGGVKLTVQGSTLSFLKGGFKEFFSYFKGSR